MKTVSKAVPVSSKTVYYPADGTGRDSYIKDRLHELIPKPVHSVERMEFQKKKYHRTLPPKHENKIVNYHSDGSGRDYYICINSGGGMDTSYHWRNQVDFKFNSSLRQYEQIPHSFQSQRNLNFEDIDEYIKQYKIYLLDLWRDCQQGFRNQKNQRQLSEEKKVASDQMNLTMRLSRPKTAERSRCMSFSEKSQNREKSRDLSSSQKAEQLQNNQVEQLRNDKEFIKKKLSSTQNKFNSINKSLNKSFNDCINKESDKNNHSFYK